MSIQVPTFNEDEIKRELKKCPKIIQDYVKAQDSALEGWSSTMGFAMKKIRLLSDEMRSLKDK